MSNKVKPMTLDEALLLHNFIVVKTDRVNHLERMINVARTQYKNMSKEQLEEAIRDIAGMKREIEEHKKWMNDAQKIIDEYFKCPSVA